MSPDIKIYVNFLQHIPQTQPIQSVLKKFKSRCYVPYTYYNFPPWISECPPQITYDNVHSPCTDYRFCHLPSFSQTILPKISIMLPSMRYICAPYYENLFTFYIYCSVQCTCKHSSIPTNAQYEIKIHKYAYTFLHVLEIIRHLQGFKYNRSHNTHTLKYYVQY